MKKTIIFLLVSVLCTVNALAALDFSLSDSEVAVPIGGTVQVTLTVTDGGTPVQGIDLEISEYCKELADPSYDCNAGDHYSPSEVGVGVSAQTDVNGEALITITHDGSSNFGEYHYTVCDVSEGSCGIGAASVTGDFFIPEFGVLASAAIVGIAGLYIARRRKKL